jgi:predicted phosphodiesterase
MRIAFISDIHEDLSSLMLALKAIEKLKCDEIICLGDTAGFSFHYEPFVDNRDVNECFRLIKQNCKHILRGNHDLQTIKELPIHRAGVEYPENWHSLNYVERAKLLYGKVWLYDDELPSQIGTENIEFIKSLPEYKIIDVGSLRILVSHYICPDFTGCTTTLIKSREILDPHLGFIEANNCLKGFSGHRHIEGALLADKANFQMLPFGKYQLIDNVDFISIPCITGGEKQNGFLIFDTSGLTIESIYL